MADLSLFDLTGKKALVTGAAVGIGRACAVALAKPGADVAVVDRDVKTGPKTAEEIRGMGVDSFFVPCDVTRKDQVQAMVRRVVEEFGRLDIAVNNAGLGILGADEEIAHGKTVLEEALRDYPNTSLVGQGEFLLANLANRLGPTLLSRLEPLLGGSQLFDVILTNVPGPQFPLYAGGAELLASYPVVPLAKGQAVSIGLTSYNGHGSYGLNADRDGMPDIDVLAACIENALAELRETVR